MGIDLSYWKSSPGVGLEPRGVYQTACCDGREIEGLEWLPVDGILSEIEAAFAKWERMDGVTWEKETGGGFQVFTTPQVFRVDGYGLSREEMARFSEMMKGYGCPLYDPQQGCRFDSLAVVLYGEAGEIREAVEEQARAVFPGLPLGEVRCLPVPEGAVPLPRPEHPVLEVFVHRGKTNTKLTANLFFGSGWTSRPTQCKTALLTNPEETKIRLAKLSDTAMKRAAEDMRQRSYHR